MRQPISNTGYLKFFVLVLVVAAYLIIPGVHDFISAGFDFLRRHDYRGLRDFILSYGVWAPITSIALMVLQSLVPLAPGVVITVTNAWIFGWQHGAMYSWVGALLGAAIDFGLARWYGRPVVERFTSSYWLKVVDTYLQRHGIIAVVISRIIPVIPFKLVSYGAGLTIFSFRQYIIATGIGQIPAIVLYSILGQHFLRNVQATFWVTVALILFGVVLYYYRNNIENYFSEKK